MTSTTLRAIRSGIRVTYVGQSGPAWDAEVLSRQDGVTRFRITRTYEGRHTATWEMDDQNVALSLKYGALVLA